MAKTVHFSPTDLNSLLLSFIYIKIYIHTHTSLFLSQLTFILFLLSPSRLSKFMTITSCVGLPSDEELQVEGIRKNKIIIIIRFCQTNIFHNILYNPPDST